jgi:hypothetical protein
MNRQEQINKLVEEAMSSLEDAQRAAPAPFLLTRIRARMNRPTGSLWEKAVFFISRPAIAFTGICLVLLINVLVIAYNKTSDNTASEMIVQNTADEFTYTTTSIYDIENTQP